MDERVRLGISACLLGEEVRYDGGHKRDGFLTGTVGRFVEWVPVCPEVEAGLGTPREPIRLVSAAGRIRVLGVKTNGDVTGQLQKLSVRRVAELAAMSLDGYVLKKDSPSCGLLRVKVYSDQGPPIRSGRGIFASTLAESLPLLPLEEEGRLQDPTLREGFIERVFAHRRLRELLSKPLRLGALVDFHARHKLQLMVHSPDAYRRLGRLVANAKGRPSRDLAKEYGEAFMGALAVPASRGRHVNVLQHIAGYFQDRIDAAARRDIADTIEDYRRGLVPLVVPITLVTHHARTCEIQYLLTQAYLQPHPKELMLRNHV